MCTLKPYAACSVHSATHVATSMSHVSGALAPLPSSTQAKVTVVSTV